MTDVCRHEPRCSRSWPDHCWPDEYVTGLIRAPGCDDPVRIARTRSEGLAARVRERFDTDVPAHAKEGKVTFHPAPTPNRVAHFVNRGRCVVQAVPVVGYLDDADGRTITCAVLRRDGKVVDIDAYVPSLRLVAITEPDRHPTPNEIESAHDLLTEPLIAAEWESFHHEHGHDACGWSWTAEDEARGEAVNDGPTALAQTLVDKLTARYHFRSPRDAACPHAVYGCDLEYTSRFGCLTTHREDEPASP